MSAPQHPGMSTHPIPTHSGSPRSHREESLLEDEQGPREANDEQGLGTQQAEKHALQRRGDDQLRHPDQVLRLLPCGQDRLRHTPAGRALPPLRHS